MQIFDQWGNLMDMGDSIPFTPAYLADLNQVEAAVLQRARLFLVNPVTIDIGGVILGAGPKPFPKAFPGVNAGEPLIGVPTAALPSGYGFFGIVSQSNNNVTAYFDTPALVIGTVVSPVINVYSLRTAP